MNGSCINCGCLVRGDRARCVPCEIDFAVVLVAHGEANCRSRGVMRKTTPPPRYRSTLSNRARPRPVPTAADVAGRFHMTRANVHIDETAKRTTRDIPACAVCKRMPRDGHDSWCTPERRENAERDRLAIDPPAPMVVRQGRPTAIEDLAAIRRDGPAAHFDLHPDELTKYGKRGADANRRRIAAEKEPPMPTLAEAAADLGLPAPSADRPDLEPAVEMADCKTCGPKPRDQFATKVDGSPHAICRTCKADAMRAARAAVNKPADSVNGSAGSANETPAPIAAADDPVDVEHLLGAVGETDEDQAEPIASDLPVLQAAMPPAPPAPIDDDIVQLEARLEDLRRVKELMAQDLVDLEHLHQLVGEAIVRKQAQGVA